MFGNSFYFLFSQTCFGEYKEKKFYIFEIKNMFGQLKFKKKKISFLKKKENTEICCYQDLNSSANSLNGTNSVNQTRVFIDF